ncbi:MAG: sugar ABC transporter permease [Thermoprotei archaeon]|nr:MAG: sugar ABC transporter permease [Thermoprotei archaeon]
MLMFIGYPIFETFRLAFTDPGTGALGLYNFFELAEDFHFWNALKYTFLLAGIIIPIQVTLALSVSLLLMSRFKGSGAVLYIFLIPLTISDVAASLIWYNMLTGSGYLNRILLNLGLISEPLHFFGYQYRNMELLAIVVTEIWRATAIVFVIIFAGLQIIGRDYLEAADVFGAGTFEKLRYIIIPMLKPSIQTALIVRTLFAMQVFAVVWVLAGRDIPVLAGEAYYWQVELKNPNVAAAYALIIAFISLFLGAVYLKLFKPKYLEE